MHDCRKLGWWANSRHETLRPQNRSSSFRVHFACLGGLVSKCSKEIPQSTKQATDVCPTLRNAPRTLQHHPSVHMRSLNTRYHDFEWPVVYNTHSFLLAKTRNPHHQTSNHIQVFSNTFPYCSLSCAWDQIQNNHHCNDNEDLDIKTFQILQIRSTDCFKISTLCLSLTWISDQSISFVSSIQTPSNPARVDPVS